jgi:uncharacterized protein
MQIIYDQTKNVLNISKHGVSLALAVEIDWDSAVFWQDTRHDYGEVRMIAIGYIQLRLYYVVFVDRDQERRIISLRKANQKEVRRYANS